MNTFREYVQASRFNLIVSFDKLGPEEDTVKQTKTTGINYKQVLTGFKYSHFGVEI